MQNYVLASVCMIILSLFGCLDGILERVNMRRSDVAYAALCVIALSGFRFKPIIEFDVDVATLALPAAFALLSFNRNAAASRMLARLSLLAAVPILVSAAMMLYELYMTTYAYFSLRAKTVCLVQIALCVIGLAVASFRFAQEKAV
ncbi:MAG TPA: hypothetical protein VN540_02860 [Clostridia bacterium]|nr:hypothetical protein [Clostridia bacterium]